MAAQPKIVTICGSSRFIDIMAVCGWIIERDEGAIVLSLHPLPRWYCGAVDDHMAEHQGVAEHMDWLHFRKIEMSDEIFVVNAKGYIGDSTRNEISYAEKIGRPIRYFTDDPISDEVINAIRRGA